MDWLNCVGEISKMTVGAVGILGLGIFLGFFWCRERIKGKVQELKDWQERREKDLKNETDLAAEKATMDGKQKAERVGRQHREELARLQKTLSGCHEDKELLKQKACSLLSAMQAALPTDVVPDARIAKMLKEFGLGGKHDNP